MTALVLDYDGKGTKPPTIDEALSCWRGFRCFLHTTKRHTEEQQRFRIVLRVSRDMTPREYECVWSWAEQKASASGHAIDEQAKDPSRFWYAPATLNGHPFVHRDQPGEPLDVDAVLAKATAPNGPSQPRQRWRNAEEAMAAVRAAAEGERNDTLNKAAFYCARRGDDQRAALADAAREAGLDEAEIERTIESAWVAGYDERPVIQLGVDIHRVADEAAAALARSDLYQRDGRLVRLLLVAEADADRMAMIGTPRIAEVPLAIVRETLSRVARWEGWDSRSKGYVPKAPTSDVASQIRDRGGWPLPVLRGITETPILRRDGGVFAERGHDPESGYLHHPSVEYHLPEPTHENAVAALAELAEVWCDFETESDAARFVPVAAVLSILARPLLGNVPLFAFDAPKRGSGKTLAVDTAAIIATGRETFKLSFSRGDEQEKVLGALALRGAPLVAFDNVTGPVDGDALNKVLTSGGRVALRVLGESKAPELTWQTTMFVSGNQLAITGDTRRRTIRFRIVPKVERPGERPAENFRHPDLKRWCFDERPRLVAAGLTVLRGFFVAGEPKQPVPTRGSFERWCSVVAAAIVWAGGPDVVTAAWEESSEPEENDEAHATLARWWLDNHPKGATAKEGLDTLQRQEATTRPSDLTRRAEAVEALASLCGVPRAQLNARHVGVTLSQLKDQVVDGVRFKARTGHKKTKVWFAEVVEVSE